MLVTRERDVCKWRFMHLHSTDNQLFMHTKIHYCDCSLRPTIIVEFVKHGNLHPLVSVLIEKAVLKTFLSTWFQDSHLRYVISIVEQNVKVSSSNIQHRTHFTETHFASNNSSNSLLVIQTEQVHCTNLLQHHVNIVEMNSHPI